jgi:hypothetical protein
MFRWLEMTCIILKHVNQTSDIFLDHAKKSAICAILKSDIPVLKSDIPVLKSDIPVLNQISLY